MFCVRDLVVISVSWMCSELLGELLSSQFISNARTTGVYSPHDFQATFNCCDSLDLLQLLEALHFCIQVNIYLKEIFHLNPKQWIFGHTNVKKINV